MLLIGNGTLVTHDPKTPFFENGCVAIKDGVVHSVGKLEDFSLDGAEFIDAKGGLIMPGLINAHNHIYSAFARGLFIEGNDPKCFLDILKGLWWNIDSHMTLEDVRYSAYWTYLDCIKNGVTTVFDHHASYGAIEGSLFEISDVAKKLGLRTCLCYEVSDRAGEAKMKEAVLENAAFIKAASSIENQCGMMGMHASFTMSDKTMEYCMENTPSGCGCHIHVAEGLDDVFDALKKYGKRTIHRLHDMGILGKHTIAGHCIHINPQEMELLEKTSTMVVHNPESNMGNAVGCPPTMELIHRGILTGLGTDGYTNDMFESLKVANILHKHNTMNPNAAWSECPEMLFENNAKIGARFFDTPIGVLKPGAAGDVVISDYIPQTPLNKDNINSHLLFGVSGRSIVTTIAAGKPLMLNRRMICADEKELMEKSRELAAKLAKRINGGKK